MDHGRVIGQGTPAQLKAEVGGRTLDVRPAERAQLDAVEDEAPGGRASGSLTVRLLFTPPHLKVGYWDLS
jgi:hypothetical protein